MWPYMKKNVKYTEFSTGTVAAPLVMTYSSTCDIDTFSSPVNISSLVYGMADLVPCSIYLGHE